jgi:hypothetical protein
LTGMFADAREFLVGGINECVSIISYSVPKIKIGKLYDADDTSTHYSLITFR